jgi:hypothetical protein
LLLTLGCSGCSSAKPRAPIYAYSDAFTYWLCDSMDAPDSFIRLSTLRGDPAIARGIIIHEDTHARDAYAVGCNSYRHWIVQDGNRARSEIRAFCAQSQWLAYREGRFGGSLTQALAYYAQALVSYGFPDIPDEGVARARLHAVCDNTVFFAAPQ